MFYKVKLFCADLTFLTSVLKILDPDSESGSGSGRPPEYGSGSETLVIPIYFCFRKGGPKCQQSGGAV